MRKIKINKSIKNKFSIAKTNAKFDFIRRIG